MGKPPGGLNLKPSVLAVSAVLGVLMSSRALAASTIVSGSITNISNSGHIDTLSITPSSTISGGAYGIYNSGSIGLVDISQGATVSGTYYAVYNNGGTISTLTNSGYMTGVYDAIVNDGVIDVLTNTGIISNTPNAIYNYDATINTLTNNSIISASAFGIFNYYASIGNIVNTGFISGDDYAIYNGSATIGSLLNSGTISGEGYALYNDAGGNLGSITNSGIILGDIYSASGLTISGGSGTTIGALSGYTTNSNLADAVGSLSITNGNLVFNGGNLILNDNVTISSGALNNTGSTLYVVNPITINGNYTQSALASLNSYVFSNTVYGQLLVTGNASIASGSSINLIGGPFGFATGQRYVVISAATGNYNQASLNYSATGYTGSIVGSSVANGSNSDLILTLVGDGTPGQPANEIKALATAPNAIASLNGLKLYSGTSNPALLNLYNASLALNTTAESNKAGEQLSPNQNASAGSATSAATFGMLNVIGNRLSLVGSPQIARTSVVGESGISAGDETLQQAVWGQAFGGRAQQDTTDDISGYRANYTGAVIGYDHAITDDWRLGGAVSYSYTSVDGKDNVQDSSSNVKSYGVTAYVGYVAPNWYSNLYAAALKQRYSTQRQVSFTGYSGTANGDFDGQQYAFKAEFGYPIALSDSVNLTPIANASYSYLRQDGYTESGGNGAALKVDSAHMDSVKSGLGAKLDTTLSTAWGEVVPYVQALWNHEYSNDKMAVTAAYAAAVDETSFVSRGSSPAKDAADLSVGATLNSSGNTSLTAYYDLGVASNYTNQSVSLRIKHSF